MSLRNCSLIRVFFPYRNQEWIRKNLRFTSEHRGLLVWDSFHAHLTDGVKELLDGRNVDVAVIPGGLTPVLQPLDKCINKPFKAKVRAQYEAWMVNGPFTYTPSGKKRAPSKEMVLRWIDRAWKEMPVDLITRSFKSCGINNALDATEDDLVWDDKEEEAVDAEELIDNKFETDSEAEDNK